jgi:hypothetical protein
MPSIVVESFLSSVRIVVVCVHHLAHSPLKSVNIWVITESRIETREKERIWNKFEAGGETKSYQTVQIMHHGEHTSEIIVGSDLQTVRYIETRSFLARHFEVSC